MPADTRALLALLTLVLLPGALVVRAPATSIPLLSLSFWLTSWWWLAPFDVSRRRFLASALVVFVLLLLLRLLRAPPRLPAPALALLLALVLARLVPFLLRPVASAPQASFQGLATLLAVVRDGLPDSYEPLLPRPGSGDYRPGLPLLSADVALLGAIPAARAAWLLHLAAAGFLCVGVFGLSTRFVRPQVAAASAAVVFALPLPAPAALALAFVVAAAGLLIRSGNPAPALAAGTLLGAAVGVDRLAAAVGLLVLPAIRRGRALAITVVTAFVVSVPLILGMASSSPGEVGAGSVFALLAVATVAWGAERLRLSLPMAALLGLVFVAGAVFRDLRSPSPLTRDDLEAMAWIAGHTTPLDAICSEATPAAAWIPAIAGRAVVPDSAASAGACRYRYLRRPEAVQGIEVAVFRNQSVAVTSFDGATGNSSGGPPVP